MDTVFQIKTHLFFLIIFIIPASLIKSQVFEIDNKNNLQVLSFSHDSAESTKKKIFFIDKYKPYKLVVDTLKQVFNDDTFDVFRYYNYGEMVREDRYKKRNIVDIGNYKNMLQHGSQYHFFDNGKLSHYAFYINGGNSLNNGQIITNIYFYKNGGISDFWFTDTLNNTVYGTKYYEDGNVKCIDTTFLDQKNKAHSINYYLDGSIISDDIYNSGKQKREAYFQNGKIMEKYHFIDMTLFKVGEETWYSENGKMVFQGFYKDGNSREEANYRIGTWSWWDEKGNLIKQEIYKDNALIETKDFLPEIKGKEK